ncbi:hypothetical protein JHK82_039973 [Glycine max]|uniref:Vacuolar protein sorting-associated protein 51 homolog n=2 Tax=Glycine subgen. Soja TaxID=1462606 RepID=K7M711_SOYBN|nr:hypothetical protein JHK86_040170 [Glycine max]RZB69069.1 Vacuolar protein sorting-associated protein 51-like [Glycine soja]KAG4965779.1 hypothetical protein JHK85_040754 [Glycine max]KAG5110750.1 hypothetical protein JHK82_039973 [Glycine max]KAG5122047.1 hypothetical protein JHK84_040387 [Glycine max]
MVDYRRKTFFYCMQSILLKSTSLTIANQSQTILHSHYLKRHVSLSLLTFSLSSQHKPYHHFANPFMVEILSPNLAKGLGNKLGYWLYCEVNKKQTWLGFLVWGFEEFRVRVVWVLGMNQTEGATIWGLRASVMKENEGELALFLKMKKHEKECNDLLLNCSEEFNAPLVLSFFSLSTLLYLTKGSILRNYIGLVIFFVKFSGMTYESFVEFIYDLPNRLSKCIKLEAYADAIRFYIGTMPIFKAYGDSSFRDCKQASVEVIVVVVKNLHGKLFSDFESIQVRAYATVLLKQLDFSVCTSFLKK